MASATKPVCIDRHIVIVYDISGSVTRQKESLKRVNGYLEKMLLHGLEQKDLNRQAQDQLNIDRLAPLWGANAGLTCLTFGLTDPDSHQVATGNRDQWVADFARLFIAHDSSAPNLGPQEAARTLTDFLKRARGQSTMYTLSRYLYPFLLCRLPDNYYAKETMLVVISDFRYGESQYNIEDRQAVQFFARRNAGKETAESFLQQLEETQRGLEGRFSLGSPVDVLVHDKIPIVIRCQRLELRSPMLGEFTYEPETLSLKQQVKDGPFLPCRMKFQVLNLPPWGSIPWMGFKLWPKKGETPFYWAGPPQRDERQLWLELPFPEPGVLQQEGLETKGNFFLTTRYQQGPWGVGVYQESRPFRLEYVTVVEAHQHHYYLAIPFLGVGLVWLLFGRRRRLGVAFHTQRETTFHQGVRCHLFEYDPKKGNPEAQVGNDDIRVEVELQRQSSWLNLTGRCRTKLHLQLNKGDFPVGAARFAENGLTHYTVTSLPRKGEKVAILLSLNHPSLASLWEGDPEDKRQPFSLWLHWQNGNQDNAASLHGLLVERPGVLWLGLDPGTTGSCVYGGTTTQNLQAVPLQVEKKKPQYIMPSIVHFLKTYGGGEKYLYNQKNYSCGLDKARGSFHTFSSMKRLIGYNNLYPIQLPKGQLIELRGEDVQSVLVDYLVWRAGEFFKETETPTQAVVAVPNSFTPDKIRQMKECCRRTRGLKRVEHIYEIEAILLYYYSHKIKDISSAPCTALVVDFGGSTLNVAVSTIRQEGPKLKVDMHSRLGFNVGGDTITAVLAEYIWDHHHEMFMKDHKKFKDLDIPHPFTLREEVPEEKRADWEELCKDLWIFAEREKLNHQSFIYKKMDKENEDEEKQDGIPEMKKLLQDIRQYIQEVVDIFGPSPRRPINAIIVTGRASLFLPFRQVLDDVQQDLETHLGQGAERIRRFEAGATEEEQDERKVCVAAGAAYYGVDRRNIDLTRDKTFAHYGLEHWTSPTDTDFAEMIPMGEPFVDDCITGKVEDLDLQFHPRQLSFYQIMAADARTALKNPAQQNKSLIQRFILDTQDLRLKRAVMTLYTGDTCSFEVVTANSKMTRDQAFVIEDIRSEMDRYTTWRLT